MKVSLSGQSSLMAKMNAVASFCGEPEILHLNVKTKMKVVLFIAFAFFVCSCNRSTKNTLIEQDDLNLYNLALETTTGSDTFLRYHLRVPPLPKNIDWNETRMKKFKHWSDSLLKILDTAEIYLVVNHNKITLDSNSIQNIIQTITTNEENLDSKMKGDTSFNDALRDLCNNEIRIDTINVKGLRTNFNYTIYSDKSSPEDEMRKLGTIIFSKIGYSKEHHRAAIYSIFICGNLCGSEQILFFGKEQGKWVYKKEWQLGVF